jgi:DNA polymerase (family 10)
MKTHELSLKLADSIAAELCRSLSGGCDKIAVAGSVRRRRPAVHDIDIVAIPKYGEGLPQTLFGDRERISFLDVELTSLESRGMLRTLERGPKAIRLEVAPEEVPVDLYIASPQTWATLLLIRTGSREHNIRLCSLARDLGMQLKADGSGLFRGGAIVARDSEESIFEALGLRYVPPEYRDAQNELGARASTLR